jgi:membrane protein YdbS with pleckstrin-like domain
MNMAVEQESKRSLLGIFPRCPFYKSALLMVLTLILIALGAIGIYYLNLWAALVYLIYSTVFYLVAMPLWHCQYCYYKVKETTKERNSGETIEKLLPLDQWKESYLEKHIGCAKKWGYNFFIIWLIPIVLIVISFFLNFSIVALISLIGFVAVLGGIYGYMRRKICTKCAIMEECHAAF